MKRFLLVFIILALIFCAAAEASGTMIVTNCEDYVTLRSEPDTGSAEIDRVSKGECVRFIEDAGNGFSRVEYCGEEGNILSKYLLSAWLRVFNCDEYVTLRSKPDTKSAEILRVPKGAVVEFVDVAPNGFYRVMFDGEEGYVLADYLTDDVKECFDGLPELPAYAELTALGDSVIDAEVGGYRVVVRRAYAFEAEREELLAVCYGSDGSPLWTASESSNVITELNATGAFIAGEALVTFCSGKGFTARAIGETGGILWTNDAGVGGGMTAAATDDGTIYAVGYYNNAPAAISADGELLWIGVNPDPENIYWPYEIIPGEDAVTVLYDSVGDGANVYSVIYNRDTGVCEGFEVTES